MMKIKLIIILLIATILMTGCWDLVEIKDRTIISALGFDKSEEDGKMVLTLQTIIPHRISTPVKASAETKPAVRIFSKTAESLSEAIIEYARQSERENYITQNRIIIIGEDMAKEGISSIMDFFMRYIDSNQRAWILICKGKAADILKWNSEIETIPANFIEGLIKTRNYQSVTSVEDVHTFVKKLSSGIASPATSYIKLESTDGTQAEAKLSNIAVFKKDKLIGILEGLEIDGYAWINNEKGRRLLEIDESVQGNIKITNQVESSKTKIVPQLINGKPAILIKVKTTTKLFLHNGSLDLNIPETFPKLEKMQEEEIKKQIKACVAKAQKEYKTDIFGFGEKIHRKYPKEWNKIKEDWEDTFSELKIIVEVDVNIRRTGLITNITNPK